MFPCADFVMEIQDTYLEATLIIDNPATKNLRNR